MAASYSNSSTINRGSIWKAGLFSVLAAVIANLIVRAILFAVLDLPAGFQPLQPVPIVIFTVLGTAAGAVVFALIASRARNPIRTYWVVALVALVVSILPNFGLMANPAAAPFPGGTAQAFGVLIVFHIVAALTSVLVLTNLVKR